MQDPSLEINFIKDFSTEKVVHLLWETAIALHIPIAIWQLPNQEEKHIVIGYSFSKKKSNLFHSNESGFCICPFSTSADESFFIPADCYYSSSKKEIIFREEENQLTNQLIATFKNYSDEKKATKLTCIVSNKKIETENREREKKFISVTEKAIQEIKKGNYQKIVASRPFIQSYTSINILDVFQELNKKYPHGFNSLVFTPLHGVWIGSSPELFLSINSSTLLKTVALAGTQFKHSTISEPVWTSKEIEEQALVSNYILDCFKNIKLDLIEKKGPETIQAGNLFHLKTTFFADLSHLDKNKTASALASLLHPTSAVCGMPKEKAKSFLLQEENYSRELYTGFWGPIEINQESNLYVNLRCMKVAEKQLTLYAGAGITYDSIPKKELEETSFKIKTILDVLTS